MKAAAPEDQSTLFKPPVPRPKLTERQGFALDQLLNSREGLSELDLGILLHQWSGKHTPDELCGWCSDAGHAVAIELRTKKLSRRRRHTGRWYATALARGFFGALPMGELPEDY